MKLLVNYQNAKSAGFDRLNASNDRRHNKSISWSYTNDTSLWNILDQLIHLSLPASSLIFMSGLNTNSISFRFPVLISTVAAMPGVKFTILPSTFIVV